MLALAAGRLETGIKTGIPEKVAKAAKVRRAENALVAAKASEPGVRRATEVVALGLEAPADGQLPV